MTPRRDDDALDIVAAARDDPDGLGLIADGRHYCFAELAELATAAAADLPPPPAPVTLVATPTPATVHRLHALLSRRQPVALVHHRLPAGSPEPFESLDLSAQPDTLAVLATSGTGGQPRAVALGRAGFLAAAAASAANLGWCAGDRWLCALPIAHVGGLGVLLRCLAARRAAVLVDAPGGAALAATIADAGVTLASLVPTQLAQLLGLDAPTWLPPPHLRAMLIGGAAADATLLGRAAARAVPFLVSYGMTETWGQVCTQPYRERGQIPDGIGPALPGMAVTIDSDDEATGRISVRTPAQMLGYLGAPPLAPGAWLPTADHGWLDERGVLHVAGRTDDVIVSGGENVDPQRVEAALLACPGVRAACVFAVPDPSWGELVAAAVVPSPGFARPVVAAAVAAQLPSFARPRLLATVDALATNATGKIDRRAVARAVAASLMPI